MAYATTADMVTRFGAEELRLITLPTSTQGTQPDQPTLQAVLDQAHAEMDMELGRHYIYPLPAGCTALLKPKVCDLALYHLLTLRRASGVEDAAKRAEAVMEWVRSGDPLPIAPRVLGLVLIDAPDSDFTDSVFASFGGAWSEMDRLS